MANILLAGDFYIDSEQWGRLTDMTLATNDYLFKRAVWDTYDRLNSALLRNAALDESDKRALILNQLASLEEIRGNYQKASSFYEEILKQTNYRKVVDASLGQTDVDAADLDAILEVLQKASRLARIQGHDEKALDYLRQSLTIARHFGLLKEEIDRLLDMASVYRKQGDYDRVHSIYDECIRLADLLDYRSGTVDILALKADLCFLEQRLQRADELTREALTRSLSMNDQLRAASFHEQLVKIGAAMNKRIFISYNHQDRNFVERLAVDLRGKGLSVWWAEWEIKVGDSIVQKVGAGISQSGYLAAVLSPSSVQSPWVQLELGSALMTQLSRERGITVLPILLADCDIPVLLRQIKWADFRRDYDVGLKQLLDVLLVS